MSLAERIPRPFKPIMSFLSQDISQLGLRSRQAPRRPKAGPASEPPEPAAWMREPSLRLMEVLSALPPVQVPDWFKQRFEASPLFRLQELQELTPAQRRQLIVLVEKTLDSQGTARHSARTRNEALASFLEQARRQGAEG